MSTRNDVSDYVDEDMEDLKVIMSGGKNYVARMTALLEMREKADRLIADAKASADAMAEASIKDRADAIGVLEDARREAGSIVSAANEQKRILIDEGEKVLNDAKEQAEKIVSDARLNAQAAEEKANKLMGEVVHAQSLLDQRSQKLDSELTKLSEKQAELDSALESANAIKSKYEGIVARLTAAMSSEIKGI